MCLCPGFGGCHPGATHCLPAWCSAGLAFLGPVRLTNEETILTGHHPQGTAQPANWGKKNSFSVKKAIACPGALASRAGFCLGTRLGATWAHSRDQSQGTPSLCFPSAPLQVSSISWKGIVHLSGVLIFFTAVQGTPLDHWVLLAKETDTCSPTGLCLSAYVKSC